MTKKTEIEADLDAEGTRHTRPGGKAADSALANATPAAAGRKKRGGSQQTRPGSSAAERAVEATKPKPGKPT